MHRREATHAAHEPGAGNGAHGMGAEPGEKDRGQPEALSYLNRRGVYDPTLIRELDIRAHRLTNWQNGGMSRAGEELPPDHGLSRTLDTGDDSERVAARHSTGSGVVTSTQPPLPTFNCARDMLIWKHHHI